MTNKDKEYIVYEIVSAKDIDEAEKIANNNDIEASIMPLDEFLEEYIDDFREQILEEEAQNYSDIRGDMD